MRGEKKSNKQRPGNEVRSKTGNRLVTSSCLDSYPESGGCEPLTTYRRYGLERKGLMEIETVKKGRLG